MSPLPLEAATVDLLNVHPSHMLLLGNGTGAHGGAKAEQLVCGRAVRCAGSMAPMHLGIVQVQLLVLLLC